MTNANKTGLVVTAHPGDFVWRAGGAIALHAKKGYRIKIACLSFGERGESQFAWKESGATLEKVKAGRRDEAQRAAEMLGAEIEFFDAGDYPLRTTEAHFDRMVDIYRELNPSFVLTHALEDPYNFDHPNAAHFAQETRVVAQAMGHKPGARYTYAAPPVFFPKSAWSWNGVGTAPVSNPSNCLGPRANGCRPVSMNPRHNASAARPSRGFPPTATRAAPAGSVDCMHRTNRRPARSRPAYTARTRER